MPQSLANLCLAAAAILYAVPLQWLLRELARKRDDGGSAVITGVIILAPMWLLLLGAMFGVIANGGFAWPRVSRTVLHLLATAALLLMAVVSFFLRFEMARTATGAERLLGIVPIQLFPLLTILFVIASLHPRVTMGLPIDAVRVPWTVIAALNLAVGGAYVGYQLLRSAGGQVAGMAYRVQSGGALVQETLAKIPALDPKADVAELARFAGWEDAAVRDAALARLRSHPEFIATLAAELSNATASSSGAQHALEVVAASTFSADEQRILAAPAQSAIERIAFYLESERRYLTKDRVKAMRAWGQRTLPAVAEHLKAGGVDFASVITAFTKSMESPAGG